MISPSAKKLKLISAAERRRFALQKPTSFADPISSSKNKAPRQSYVLLRTVLKLNRIRYLPTGGQRAICFLPFLLALRRVIKSLLLWEKVAAVRLTDEELVLRLVTPHPPLTRSPFPHWGRLFVRHEKPSTFLDKHCFCGHKDKAPREAGQNIILKLAIYF